MNFSPKSFFVFISVVAFLFSCSVEKRLYNNGYHVEWNHKMQQKETAQIEITESQADLATIDNSVEPESQSAIIPFTENAPPCDSIKLKNGETKPGIVQEIGVYGITYKDCDGTGPARVIDKSTVESIRYGNGKEEKITEPPTKPATEQNPPVPKTEEKELEGFGLAGFIFSLVGVFFAGIPLGILAMIFGIIGISRSVNHPSKYVGKAFGVLSLIFGLIVLILTLAIVL